MFFGYGTMAMELSRATAYYRDRYFQSGSKNIPEEQRAKGYSYLK